VNSVWSRLLKSWYRREPVVSLVVTAGMVDAAIGGFSEHWFLLALGLGTVGVAIALRFRQFQQPRLPIDTPRRAPMYSLPEHSSRTSLPRLTLPNKNSSDKY